MHTYEFEAMGDRKQPYSTRLDPDVSKAVDRYGEDHGLTDSEAVRRLVNTGLETASGPTNEDVREDIRDDLQAVKESIRSIEVDRDDDGDDETETITLNSPAAELGGVVNALQLTLLVFLVLIVSGIL